MSRDDRIKQFRALLGAFHDDLEGIKTVYHYTSAQGFRGIIDRGELWLTNTAFVNDTTECRALWQLTDLFDKCDLQNPFVRERWESRLHARAGLSRPGDTSSLYIASFSQKGDSLEQWRAYGGFCIGFDPTNFARRGFTWHKCVYTKDDIREWILHKSRLGGWQGDSLEDAQRRLAAGELLSAASTKYKSHYYEGEKELRLATISNHTWEPYSSSPGMFAKDPPIHFRDHPVYRVPIPYVKFFVPLPGTKEQTDQDIQGETATEMRRRKLKVETEMARGLLPISEVRIGPMAQQEQAKLACEIMLCEKGYENVAVIASEIPYRGS